MRINKKLLFAGTIFIFLITVGIIFVSITGKKSKDKMIYIEAEDDEDVTQTYWRPDAHSMTKVDGGYYYLTTDMKLTTYLRYFDAETKQSIPVCAKAECTHDTSECNSYFGKYYLMKPIYYYNGYLYMVKVEGGMSVLVRVDKDGSNRKDIAQLFPNEGSTSVSMVFHNGKAYAYDHLGHVALEEEYEETIKEVDLSTGDTRVVYSYKGTNSAITDAKSYGNKLFFQIFYYSVDKEKAVADMYHILYCYDYETGETEKVSDKDISDYCVDTDNNVLYYFEVDKGLFSRKLNEEKSELLYESDDTIKTASLSFDGKNLYMSNGGIGSTTNLRNQIDLYIYVLNSEGKVVNTIIQNSREIGSLLFGDSDYLFLTKQMKLYYINKSNIEKEIEMVPVE